ncbi:MAG: dynamin family protein [Spirochaetaceae bacterium]|nr:dynamin family protein [Spirochaetaceae bacterium]
MTNILEDFQIQKQKVVQLTRKAVEFGWLASDRGEEIIKKIQDDILTIGVIGQMKCGKSTFLNSFIFGSDVLPAATTPMTASLSVITYGEQEKMMAEFYTKEEWEEQRRQATRNLAELEGNEVEKSKVQAAQELVSKASKLGSSLESYLGKTQEDKLENLVEYVGADGKYISITKAVKIYYPKEYLKGVEIVDTPGMNDPIVSREERTKEFLKKADVVLMMLYAGRPFDAKDRTILFEDVKKCGPGKVIIGINKYDIPYMNGESEDEIKEYVKAEINKQCKECGDETLVELVQEREPILLSANMALLSQLAMEKINRNETYSYDWNRYCDLFEISGQKQLRDKSHMDELGQAVINLITKEKGDILLVRPQNEIMAAGQEKRRQIEEKIVQLNGTITIYETPDESLDDMEQNLARAKKRMERKLSYLDLDEVLDKEIAECRSKLNIKVDTVVTKMCDIIQKKNFFEKYSVVQTKMQLEHSRLSNTLKSIFDECVYKCKSEIRKKMNGYFDVLKEICHRNLEGFELDDLITSFKDCISFRIDDNDIRQRPDVKILSDAVNHGKKKEALLEKVLAYQESADFSQWFEVLRDGKQKVLAEVHRLCHEDIIDPLEKKIKECKDSKGDKVAKLSETRSELARCEVEKENLAKQLQEIKTSI